MARARISKFAARQGATLTCSADGAPILKGESYYWWKPGFRSRYKVVRCMKHAPRQSELTSSKMSGVYAAIEGAEDALDAIGGPEDDASSLQSILQDAASGIEEVAEEYREANEASPTGMVFGEDLNERADEISDAAREIEDWSPSEDEPDFDSCDDDMHDEDATGPDGEEQEVIDRGSEECESCQQIKQAWWDQCVNEARDALGNVQL